MLPPGTICCQTKHATRLAEVSVFYCAPRQNQIGATSLDLNHFFVNTIVEASRSTRRKWKRRLPLYTEKYVLHFHASMQPYITHPWRSFSPPRSCPPSIVMDLRLFWCSYSRCFTFCTYTRTSTLDRCLLGVRRQRLEAQTRTLELNTENTGPSVHAFCVVGAELSAAWLRLQYCFDRGGLHARTHWLRNLHERSSWRRIFKPQR